MADANKNPEVEINLDDVKETEVPPFTDTETELPANIWH